MYKYEPTVLILALLGKIPQFVVHTVLPLGTIGIKPAYLLTTSWIRLSHLFRT